MTALLKQEDCEQGETFYISGNLSSKSRNFLDFAVSFVLPVNQQLVHEITAQSKDKVCDMNCHQMLA